MEMEKFYVAEVLEVEVEKGFEGSVDDGRQDGGSADIEF